MAEKSMFWTTGVAGDGQDRYPYTYWTALWRALLAGNYVSAYGWGGIFPSPIANEKLAVSGATSPLSIQVGRACVYGFIYENDAAASLVVPTPGGGTTGKCVVLRANWAARTVRITLLTSPDGTAAIPAITQTPDTTYDIKLADLTITTGGAITLTDRRRFLGFASQMHRYHTNGDASYNLGVTGGANSFALRAPTFAESGVVRWTGASATSGSVVVTFNEAFSTIPLVFANCLSNDDVRIRCVPTASNFTLYWTAAGTKTQIDFSWMAIGLIGSNA